VELFDRLKGWDYVIVASRLNHLTGEAQPAQAGFVPVYVLAYTGNDWKRILNWASYAVSALYSSVRRREIDAIYASSPHLLAGLSGWAVAAIRRVPFILEVRDLWPRVLVDMGQIVETSVIFRALTTLESFLYRRAARIVVMAEGSRSALVERGVPASKIVYIPNGADSADFVPLASRAALRERYGFRRLTAVYAGAHGPANDLSQLLEAASALDHLDVDIVLVGNGVCKTALVAEASARGLANVRFMEPIPKSEVPDLLHAADVGLHVLADVELFRTAVSPNKVFDYMAAGLPVITNCPGATTALIEDASCGIATEPHKLASGITAMSRMGTSERSALGANGATWIDKHQSRTAMARRLQQLLEGLPRVRA
jgi:glycosyltransferase involved in cell wall biosynthesis